MVVGPVSAAATDAVVVIVPLVRCGGDGRNRRDVLLGKIVAATVVPLATWSLSSTAVAAPKLRPDDAYASLVAARGELRYATNTYLPKGDWEGMRVYLECRLGDFVLQLLLPHPSIQNWGDHLIPEARHDLVGR